MLARYSEKAIRKMGTKLKALLAHPGYLLGIVATLLGALVSAGVIPATGTAHQVVTAILAALAAGGITSAGLWTPPPSGKIEQPSS